MARLSDPLLPSRRPGGGFGPTLWHTASESSARRTDCSARLSDPLLPSRRPAVRTVPGWRGRVVGLPSGTCLAYGRFATDVASPGAGGSNGPRCGSLPTVYASGIMFPRLTRVTVRQVDCLGTRSCIANRPGRARAASTSRLSRARLAGPRSPVTHLIH